MESRSMGGDLYWNRSNNFELREGYGLRPVHQSLQMIGL